MSEDDESWLRFGDEFPEALSRGDRAVGKRKRGGGASGGGGPIKRRAVAVEQKADGPRYVPNVFAPRMAVNASFIAGADDEAAEGNGEQEVVFQLGDPDPVRRAYTELEEEEVALADEHADMGDDEDKEEWCFACKCTKSELDMSRNKHYTGMLDYIRQNMSKVDIKSLATDVQFIYETFLRGKIRDPRQRRTWKRSTIIKHLFEHTLDTHSELERDIRGIREIQASVYRECINPNANVKAIELYMKLSKQKIYLLEKASSSRRS